MSIYLARKAEQYLYEWRLRKNRKPLIIRGARQVGKSTLVEHFGSQFDHFIKLNLEREAERQVFIKIENVHLVLEQILIQRGIELAPEKTLLFIDEIQESPKAIELLRYFYEEYPELNVIAAGSLLEFALKDVRSFPVGRVEHLELYPLDFEEFLLAVGNTRLIEAYHEVPVSMVAHDALLDQFHRYAMIGGMPEIVTTFLQLRTAAGLAPIYHSLWQSYQDDVEKYAIDQSHRKVIRHIMNTAPFANDRITLAGFGNSNYKSREVREAFDALQMARVMALMYPTTALRPPLVPNFRRRPRLQLMDTGMLNFAMGIQSDMIGLRDLNDFSRGKIVQHVVGQQLMAQTQFSSMKPTFWVREKNTSSAEIDFCIQHRQKIIPIEVKSGKVGKLRSLHQFMEQANHTLAIRLLANHIQVEQVQTPSKKAFTLANLPYFIAGQIEKYIEWIESKQ